MLKRVSQRKVVGADGHYAIVASRFNARYVEALLRHARAELRTAGVTRVEVVRVPGAFEIPVVVAALARTRLPRLSAVLCLGVIFQGETSHARHIGEAVSGELARLAVESGIPLIHGVYVFENEEQARVRCLGRTHNRGVELARTALAMAQVMRDL
jgi:6,7-dimethyl-8-ribityllumazine synthase